VASHGRDFASLLGLSSANIGHYTAEEVSIQDPPSNNSNDKHAYAGTTE
jgi:hypothetical protein